MPETVAEILARLLETAAELNARGTPEPDTADEDEADPSRPMSDTATPEKNG